MRLPVVVSPINAIALISLCSVNALPAVSPKPCTRFHTPAGSPASCAIWQSRVAVIGLSYAGLCTTVQPAAKAGATFQVVSINGVFQGVMTPTGPIGCFTVKFKWLVSGVDNPLGASMTLSAKYLKLAAPLIAAFFINLIG